MKELKTQYELITSQRKELINQINILESDEKIKRYFELIKQSKELHVKQTRTII